MGMVARLSPAEQDARKSERMAIGLRGGLRELGAVGGDVRILNLSATGFMVEADALYQAGTYVWLHLPGVGRMNAQIRWRDSFRYGCEFTTPLSPAQWEAARTLSDRAG